MPARSGIHEQVPTGYEFSGVRVTAQGTAAGYADAEHLAAWLPGVGPALAGTPLVSSSPLAAAHRVPALTHAGTIHLGPAAQRLPESQMRQVLAHEGVHVLQQRTPVGSPGDRVGLELEAQQLAGQVTTGRSVAPVLSAGSSSHLHQTPADELAVERARRRLAVLHRFVDQYAAREGRRLRIGSDRDPLLQRRRQMDRDMPVPAPPEIIAQAYSGREREQMATLNRRPLRIEVSETAVRFHARFHVRFEAVSRRDAERRFPVLLANLRQGLRQTWDQELRGMPLAGRRFELVPEVALIGAAEPRDLDYWLISVRPSDTAPITYEGRPVADEQAPADVPTSVTATDVGGGVMSLPPSHVTKPDVLGHEVLHLFGLVDRYLTQEVRDREGGALRGLQHTPMRETGGRPDPLATETGPILREDLNALFEHLGVYRIEQVRGLDVLTQLEAEGMTLAQATAEIMRLEEVVRLGRDPRSLIRPREDFRQRVLDSVQEL